MVQPLSFLPPPQRGPAGEQGKRPAAARSTLTTASTRCWKKSWIRSRHTGSSPTFWRAYMSTSSTSTRVPRPSFAGRASRRARSGSAGGVSRSSGFRLAVEQAETLVAGELEGQHAPGMAEGAARGRPGPAPARSRAPRPGLSKQSETMAARGSSRPAASRNSPTAATGGSEAGSRNR